MILALAHQIVILVKHATLVAMIATIAIHVVVKNALGGKSLKTNVVVISQIAIVKVVVHAKDVTGGNSGKTDVV